MAGDPANARLWTDADVYVGATDAVNPADIEAAFGNDWDLVGLLDGEEGFTEAREEEKEDHYAWGGILVRTARRNFKLTRRFVALESNAVTRSLRWPGSEDGEIIVPRPIRQKIAFEKTDSSTGAVHRLISKYEAEIEVDGDVTENEEGIASCPFLVTIFPDSDGVLFVEQESEVASA